MGRKAFELTLPKYQAACILAMANNDQDAKGEAAAAARVTVRTIELWLQNQPAFAGLVGEIRKEFSRKALERIEGESLADFETRIRYANERHSKLRTIIEERARVGKDDVPGDKTGLLKTKVTETVRGNGERETTIVETEFDVDTGILSAMNQLEMSVHKQVMDLTQPGEERDVVAFIVD